MDGPKVPSSKAEASAVLCAMNEARAHGFRKPMFLSDGQEVVHTINGTFDWSIDPILLDIKILANDFETADFSFIPRKWNLVAHNFAQGPYSKNYGVRNVAL